MTPGIHSQTAAATADDLIRRLELTPHPEGGYFRETFRSDCQVTADDGRRRSAMTAIYYLLRAGEYSAWHTVRSDEQWHWYAGGALVLRLIDASGRLSEHVLGGSFAHAQQPQIMVPAGVCQSAECAAGCPYVLCGCSVAPGFDFADFDMPDADALLARWPQHHANIRRFVRVRLAP